MLRKSILLGASMLALIDQGFAENAIDKTFFEGAHLGMNIKTVRAYYHKLDHVVEMWHSGAPDGELQSDFRNRTNRVYVYYRKASGEVVSVIYMKLDDDKSFSPTERNELLKLNSGHGSLTTPETGDPTEFEVTTPKQADLEANS